jgi:NAD(P)-dependent dehydrogenase (short-subunit alcohol dehydrogenase family)
VSARRALVTGGERGIGAEVVAALRARGDEVVTLDVLATADYVVDLSSSDPLPDFGDVDVVVSNAAITTTISPSHRMTDEQWARDILVNLTGAYRVIRACLAGMREREYGRIVVVASQAATQGLPGQVAYSASKAGLLGMVKTIAAENVAKGITANSILPGMIGTEAVRAMPPEILEALSPLLPSGRMGEPSEVAALVAFLASEQAGYITGQDIAISGGGGLNTTSLARAAKD